MGEVLLLASPCHIDTERPNYRIVCLAPLVGHKPPKPILNHAETSKYKLVQLVPIPWSQEC